MPIPVALQNKNNNMNKMEGFQVNLSILGWFLVYVLLESFMKFLVDPYYKPLPWFMIRIYTYVIATTEFVVYEIYTTYMIYTYILRT